MTTTTPALLRLQQLEHEASVEVLAAIIRQVDGNHRLGAADLAEAILAHPASCWQPAALPDRDDSIDAEAMKGLERLADDLALAKRICCHVSKDQK